MLDLNYQRLVIGYHGCDARVVSKVLAGEDGLVRSERDYDWLGPGIYFWEHGPQRAYDWATEEHRRDPGKIPTPAVLGAYLNLGQCFDLLDTANTRLLQEAYPEFLRLNAESGRAMPLNKPARPGSQEKVLHYLDCAVIRFSLGKLAESGDDCHSVRGVFLEGGEAFPGAGIRLKSHIQVAVRDPRCIIGYFRPNPNSYRPNQ